MKVLYAMHINWNWIRQRPHVLAEQLAQRHRVELLHFKMYRPSHRAAEAPPPFPARELLRIPQQLKRLGKPLQALNAAWLERQVTSAVQTFRPDALWVTHPDFEPALRAVPGTPLVYDCMDDHAAFNEVDAGSLLAAERRLLERADLVLFSSATLADRVRSRATVRHFEVVNNGVADNLLSLAQRPPRDRALGGPVLGFFGAVSHFFDWPLVLELLASLPTAQLQLAGPVETRLPRHPRVHHVGILPHEALADFAAGCDVMLMPFVVNRLIEAVDPVKLYEYIAFGRPALAPRYPESERFAQWVALYRNVDEAVSSLSKILATDTSNVSGKARAQFLAEHAWSKRAIQIERLLAPLASGQAVSMRRAPG